MEYLQQVKAFLAKYIPVSDEEFSDMAKIIKFTSHDKNEFLHRSGDIFDRFLFILDGAVRSYYIDKNQVEHTVFFGFENEPVLDINSFLNQTPTATFSVTLEPTVLVNIHHTDFFGFLAKYPRYEAVLRNVITEYMILEGEHSSLLRISSARERYKVFVKKRGHLLNRVPLKYIASYLGMAIETLSRARGKV